MHRRHLLQTTAFFASTLALAPRAGVLHARQAPEASPEATPAFEDEPVDPRARQLVTRLAGLSPLAVLEALETGEVAAPDLIEAGGGAPVSARPWNDPLDTDLEHALGGVLIVASDEPVNSPELVTLGAYIVFESPEIAFDVLSRELAEMEDGGSMSVAGAKAWLVAADETQLAIMRFGYVLVIVGDRMTFPNAAEGLVDHLDGLTQTLQ